MSLAEITLERQTANDESATISSVLVRTGKAVRKGELIFEIENSKAVEEYHAPADGILLHQLCQGQQVNFGSVIARIVAEDKDSASSLDVTSISHPHLDLPEALPLKTRADDIAAAAARSVPLAHQGTPTNTSRARKHALASRAAVSLAAQHGIKLEGLELDFITSDEVRKLAGLVSPDFAADSQPFEAKPLPRSVPRSAHINESAQTQLSGELTGVPLGQRKRAEIEVLGQGAGATLLSVLGIRIGFMPVIREAGDPLAGSITDLVLYEASRLVRKFPNLNAAFQDGRVRRYDSVHGGIAFDRGSQLIVYGIQDSDKLGLTAIAEAIVAGVGRYMDDKLTTNELTRATYTVTDLSEEDLDFVFPLLPRGQSLILAITRNASDGFRIFAGFDHRVTEGREVAIFLGELRDRLLTFCVPQLGNIVPIARCEYCDRSAAEVNTKSKERGLLKLVEASGREVFCCGSCWNGW